MKECEICASAVSKLRLEGWEVYCEVNVFHRPADAVGIRGTELVVVEAKRMFSATLKEQLLTASSIADYIIAVVGSVPVKENIEWCRKFGIGLWVVKNLMVSEIISCSKMENRCEWARAKTVKMFEAMRAGSADNVGGMPTQLGIGPAIECAERVANFLIINRNSSWKRVFDSVPNHYASASSMATAMRRSEIVRAAIYGVCATRKDVL